MTGRRLVLIASAAGALVALVVALLTSGDDRADPPAVWVVVARGDIAAGTTLRAEQLAVQAWSDPATPPPAGAAGELRAVEGSIARQDIGAGRVIRGADLWPGSVDGALMPEPGRLAYTTPTTDIGRVIGFEGPGSRVDVLLSATRNVPQPFSRLVLRSVRVLAVSAEPAEAKADSAAPRSSRVTLELTPRQAERLDLARHVGELTLMVRSADGPADDEIETPGARIGDLLGRGAQDLAPEDQTPAAAPAPVVLPRGSPAPVQRHRPMVEEIRGGQLLRREEPA